MKVHYSCSNKTDVTSAIRFIGAVLNQIREWPTILDVKPVIGYESLCPSTRLCSVCCGKVSDLAGVNANIPVSTESCTLPQHPFRLAERHIQRLYLKTDDWCKG